MATTKKPADQQVDRFEELRQRAIKSGKLDTTGTTDKPFILDDEWGFKDDPITVEKPRFTKAELIAENVRAGAILNAMRHLFGPHTGRVAAKLDTLGDEAGPAALMLIEDVLAHFYGPGAMQVFPR